MSDVQSAGFTGFGLDEKTHMIGRKIFDFLGCARGLGRTLPEKFGILWRQTKNVRVRFRLAEYHPARVLPLPTRMGKLYLRDNFGDVTNLPGVIWRNSYRCTPLAEEGVILDAGANIGLFSFLAARLNPGRPIHCFEPLPSNVSVLRMNCPEAIVHCVALGRQKGKTKIGVDRHGIMASSIATSWPVEQQEFDVVALDEVTAQQGIRNVAFLKLDAEGMEAEILAGGYDTLRRTQRVAMETHSEKLHAQSTELLQDAGFTIDDHNFNGRTGMIFASRHGSEQKHSTG